jgi:hypothetical protein
MARSWKKRQPSLGRRLLYFFMLASGSGSVGGWVFRNHPATQAIWTLVTGKPAAEAARDLDDSLRKAVGEVLDPVGDFRSAGVYQVTIPEVHLDPLLFKAGHTVDIQARVLKLDAHGRDATLWETKPYGQRLAVAGRDELSAGWPLRPFQVDWSPGEQLVVEVFDRKPGLFFPPKRFILTPAEAAPREFPLKTGTFPLQLTEKPSVPPDPRNTRIVFKSQRVGDLPASDHAGDLPPQARSQSASWEAPIIIK